MTDPGGNVTRFTYDAADRLSSTTSPSGVALTFGRDALGNITSVTDGDGRQTTMVYDSNGHRTAIQYADGTADELFYDAVGQLIRDHSVDTERSFGYDDNGRLISVYDSASQRTLKKSYDVSGHVIRQQLVEDDVETSFDWDLAGNLVGLTDSQGGRVGMAYDAVGRRVAVMYPNGVSGAYAYNARSQLTSLVWQHGQELLDAFLYDYDDAGRVIRRGRADDSAESYSYDVMNRLTAVASSGGAGQQYDYDDNGNRVHESSRDGEASYAYSANQLVTKASANGQSATLTYDARGNLRARGGADQTSYSFDARNELVSVSNATSSTQFGYTASGLRSRVDDATGRRRMLTDHRDEYADVDADSKSLVSRQVADPGRIDDLLLVATGDGVRYPILDGANTVWGLSNQTGSVSGRFGYDAFGTRTVQSGESTAWGFQGRRAEANLRYHRARYAGPDGQWISPDPIGFAGGTNWYQFLNDNPMGKSDPSGYVSMSVCGAWSEKLGNNIATVLREYPVVQQEVNLGIQFDKGNGTPYDHLNELQEGCNGIVNNTAKMLKYCIVGTPCDANPMYNYIRGLYSLQDSYATATWVMYCTNLPKVIVGAVLVAVGTVLAPPQLPIPSFSISAQELQDAEVATLLFTIMGIMALRMLPA